MKISPVASSAQVSTNPDEGKSAGSDRIARAKAAMNGEAAPVAQTEQTTGDAQADRALASVKRIKMRTQRSVNRHGDPVVRADAVAAETPVEPSQAPETTTPSDTLANIEQTQVSPEATEAMSPQFAALAKAKRALQAKERELATREAALTTPQATPAGYSKDQIKANALSVLREAGVTNEELTEAILRESQDYGPGYTKLESEVQELKKLLENQNKSLEQRELDAEKQVLTQVRRDVDSLIATGDDFEAVREAGYAPKVVDLIYKVFKQDGEILDIADAAKLINDELIEESLKFAKLKTVQSRLTPPAQQQPAAKQPAPNTKTMRTLTNRDGTSSLSMSKRERAIAAAEGRLKQ